MSKIHLQFSPQHHPHSSKTKCVFFTILWNPFSAVPRLFIFPSLRSRKFPQSQLMWLVISNKEKIGNVNQIWSRISSNFQVRCKPGETYKVSWCSASCCVIIAWDIVADWHRTFSLNVYSAANTGITRTIYTVEGIRCITNHKSTESYELRNSAVVDRWES